MKRLSIMALSRAVMTCVAVSLTASTADTQESLTVNLEKQKVKLVAGGQAVAVRVEVTCSQGSTILESLLYIVQDGNTSEFSSIPVVCDGILHEYVVRVRAFPETLFHRGKAISSAYVLLADPEGTSAGDTERLRMRR